MRKIFCLVVISLSLAVPLYADNPLKEGGKEVGEGFKKMGKETGRAFKEGGKEVGHGFKKMGKETGQAAKKTGKGIGEWFREMGRSIKRFFTGR